MWNIYYQKCKSIHFNWIFLCVCVNPFVLCMASRVLVQGITYRRMFGIVVLRKYNNCMRCKQFCYWEKRKWDSLLLLLLRIPREWLKNIDAYQSLLLSRTEFLRRTSRSRNAFWVSLHGLGKKVKSTWPGKSYLHKLTKPAKKPINTIGMFSETKEEQSIESYVKRKMKTRLWKERRSISDAKTYGRCFLQPKKQNSCFLLLVQQFKS